MMETQSSSEASVLTKATRRNIPEDVILHSHRSENIKSYIALIGWTLQRSNVSSVRYELGFYIPQDGILHSYRRENVKSCKLDLYRGQDMGWNRRVSLFRKWTHNFWLSGRLLLRTSFLYYSRRPHVNMSNSHIVQEGFRDACTPVFWTDSEAGVYFSKRNDWQLQQWLPRRSIYAGLEYTSVVRRVNCDPWINTKEADINTASRAEAI
jgi:hypothetical protein